MNLGVNKCVCVCVALKRDSWARIGLKLETRERLRGEGERSFQFNSPVLLH